jgi:hypothetical protein
MVTLFQILLTSLPFFYNNRKENSTLPNCHENCCKDLHENFRYFRMFLHAIIFTFSQKFQTKSFFHSLPGSDKQLMPLSFKNLIGSIETFPKQEVFFSLAQHK